MRRAALIYNPASGQYSRRHRTAIEEALGALRAAGVEAEAVATTGPGSAGEQALEAAERGCDTILACGGDGTVHEVLQTLVGTETVLGVLPLGTANALAADMGLSPIFGFSAAKAVEKLLAAKAVRIPVGRVFYRDKEGRPSSRYFTVAAGVGADALFLSRLDAKLKRRLGYVLYMIEGLRVWVKHSFPLFEARFEVRGEQKARVERVTQLLAVRVRDFGGVLHELVPGASLHKESLRLLVFKTRNRFDYLRFFMAVVCARHTFSHKIEAIQAVSVECRALEDSALEGAGTNIYVEADGEILGTLPVRMEIVPQALRVWIPAG